MLKPGVPEPPSERYILYAHGATAREDPQTLVIPENLRVVFFYDPDRADSEIFTCKEGLTTLCTTASNQTRWVYGPGKHKIRSMYVVFSEEGDSYAKQSSHSFGLYKCDDKGMMTRQQIKSPRPPSYDRIHRPYDEIPLNEAIPFALFSNANPTTPTTLYISTCNARQNLRSDPVLKPFLTEAERNRAHAVGATAEEYAALLKASQKSGKRRKTRRSKRTKRRGTRHARVR